MAISKIISESLDLTDNYAFTGTITGAGESNTPLVSVKMSGTQITTDATATLVAFNSVEIDTDSAFTNTAGNYKFTVPSGKDGTYMITYMATSFNENSTTIHVQGHIYVNGSTVAYQRQRHDGTNNATTRHSGTTTHWVGDLSVGDYVQFYYYHDVTSDVPQSQGTQQSRATIMRIKAS